MASSRFHFSSFPIIILIILLFTIIMEAQVPEDPTERQAWMATMYYSHIREQARQGAGGMWLSAWSLCQSINTRFHLGSQSSEYLERDMHHMWYTYCHAGSTHPSP